MKTTPLVVLLCAAGLLTACGGSSNSSNSSSSSSQPASQISSSSSITPSSSSVSSEQSSEASSVISSEESSSSVSSSVPATAWVCPTDGLYFCDDFAGNKHDKWTLKAATENATGPNGAFDIADDNGNYILRHTAASTGGVIALVKPEAFAGVTSADYYVEAKIRPRENGTTGNKQIYLITRYVDDNNWYAGALNVQNATTSTQVEIAKMKGGSISRPKQVKKPIEQGEAGKLDGQWYILRIEALGNNLTVYLDGESIATQTDSDFTNAGLIGLWTANKSFEIDDIKVGNANDKPASLLISPAANSYAAEVGDAPRTITITAKTDAGADDSVTVVSTDSAVVSVNTSGSTATLTPVGEGSATITFTSGSGLVRTIIATIAPQFVMPTATYNFTNQLSPAAGEVNAYEDATLTLTFDSAPSLGSAGSVRIFKTSDDSLVDKIALVDEADAIGFGTLRNLKTRPIRISGNTASINLHANKLEPGTSYYVAVSGSVFTGANLAGQSFAGIGKNANWSFTTRPALAAGLTSLLVDDNGTTANFRSVQGALNYAMKNIALDDAVTITINNGIYEEPLYLRSKNNVTLIGESRDNTIIQYPNNELLNSGSTGRALFLVEAADMLTLENLTLKNTTLIGAGGQAETIYFNSPTGRLIAKNANFISEQDTLLLKGWTWFYNTLVAGNVDFIWGYSKASLFEKSEIRSIGRSTGNNNGGYVLQARVEAAGDKGFVFLNSRLTAGEGPMGELPVNGTHYLARSPGGTATFDNIVFVNTKMGAHIAAGGWAGLGVNSQPAANPATGTATTGWREYNSMDLNGAPLTVTRQFSHALSLAEIAGYCSRAQVFSAYNNGAGWNPLPDDISDCVNVEGVATSSSSSSSSIPVVPSSSSQSSSSVSSVESSSSVSSVDAGGTSSNASSSAASITSWTGAAFELFGSSTSVPVGSVTTNTDNAVTITAKGGSLNTSNRKFFFASKDVTGDFVFTARLSSVTLASGSAFTVLANNQFRYGLLIAESVTPRPTYPELGRFAELGFFTNTATPTFTPSRAYKLDMGGATTQSRSSGSTPNIWAIGDYLRITKAGSTITLAYSTNGVTFTDINSSSFVDVNGNPFATTMKVGFYAASGADELTFVYDNISITQ